MKSRKTRMFVALGLLAISGFSLIAISFADEYTGEYKNIKLDANNAIQTIPTVIFKPSLQVDNSVELRNVAGKRLIQVVTNTNNFILSNGDSTASGGSGSTILGGNDNHMDRSNYSTIIAGEKNIISVSSHGVIGGGSGNVVGGHYGTVAGGEGNTANKYAVAVGGEQNSAIGENSVAIGYNATARGNNSVAMGKDATVEGSNSFLWNDGTEGKILTGNSVFAVVGKHGMVINETKAHRFAKLTIGGSLIVRESSINSGVVCGLNTAGVLKVVNRTGDANHVCFCSCDGTDWHSLFGGGACASLCDSAPQGPQCDPYGVTKNCEGGIISYSGGCLVGDLVEGNGAFLVDNNGDLRWTCQTEDGAQIQCKGVIPYDPSCNDPRGEGVCTGNPENAIFEPTTDIAGKGYYDNYGPKLYNRRSDILADPTAKCAWYCSGGYYLDTNVDYCLKNKPCRAQEFMGYSVPRLEDGELTGVNKPGAAVPNGTNICTNTVRCDNEILSLVGTDNCNIQCDAGYYLKDGKCAQDGACDNGNHYNCLGGTLGTSNYSEALHKWTWTCLGINGGSDSSTCSENDVVDGDCGTTPSHYDCVVGESVSNSSSDPQFWRWSCMGYNGGDPDYCEEPKPCTVRTCNSSVYPLTSCPEHGICSSCTPVDSECNSGTPRYSLDDCEPGWHRNGNVCEADPSCTETTCSSSYSYSSCPSGKGCTSCTAIASDCTTTTKYKVDCTINECDDEYSYSSCPSGSTCASCTSVNSSCSSVTKYKPVGSSCTPTTCDSSYNQTSCPSGKGCSSCTSIASDCSTTTKYKVDCTLNSCGSDYSYSSCPSGSTCDSCTSVDSNCNSVTKYKVTGSICTPTTCSSSYSYSSCPNGKGCSSCTALNSDCSTTTKYKVDCTLNTCSSDYSLTSCPSGSTCDSCTSVDSDCNSVTKYKVTGSICTETTCSSSYSYSSCPNGKGCSSCTSIASDCTTTTKYKVDCTTNSCSSDYSLTSCPSGKGCSSCTAVNSNCTSTVKYKVDCTLNTCSSDYSLTSCPAGKTCDSCTSVNSNCVSTTKYKETGCQTTSCGAEYTYSSCPSGKICESCTRTNADCSTTTKYKVTGCVEEPCDSSYDKTSCPTGKTCDSCTATNSNCTTAIKYKVTGCVEEPCDSSYDKTSCPTGKTCDSCTATNSNCTTTTKYKVTGCEPTTCADDYSYASCPANAECDSCTMTTSSCGSITKYRKIRDLSDPCEDYPLESCPDCWTCDVCPSNSSRYRKNSCKPECNLYNGDCYKCIGNYPDHAVLHTGTVTSNKYWGYSPNLNGYCQFKCEDGYTYDYPGYHVCKPLNLCTNYVDGCENGATQNVTFNTNGLKKFTCTLGNRSQDCHYCYENGTVYVGGNYCTALCKNNEQECNVSGATKSTSSIGNDRVAMTCKYDGRSKQCYYCNNGKVYDATTQTCKTPTTTQIKVDWNGNDFEWELGMGYFYYGGTLYSEPINYRLYSSSTSVPWDGQHHPGNVYNYHAAFDFGKRTVYLPYLTHDSGNPRRCSIWIEDATSGIATSSNCTSYSEVYRTVTTYN